MKSCNTCEVFDRGVHAVLNEVIGDLGQRFKVGSIPQASETLRVREPVMLTSEVVISRQSQCIQYHLPRTGKMLVGSQRPPHVYTNY